MIRAIRHHSGPPTLRSILRRLRAYFPVAGASMNPLVATSVGGVVGFLSGLFGVGGGFLMTPLLIFIGIPAAVAAATDSAQITAGATSGVVSHARFGNVDFKMGLAMVAGGWPGGFLGVHVVHMLRNMGNFDFYLKVVYVVLLGFAGGSMFLEGVRTLRGRSARAEPGPGRLAHLFDRAPFQMAFPKSGLRTSALEPAAVGFLVGILAAFLGVGGGFMLIPAMVYIIGIPTRIAVGTGLFQEVLICAFVTLRQATSNHTVDLLLAVALFIGSTVGAQIGVLANRRLRGEQIRVLLALVILAVMVALLYQLVAPPALLVEFARSGGLPR
ncbi:MAG TPA: sulfite exporter TauE/SafE family protein [Acidobacteria bacterium]|nr:sulfite exporter TauE/SafE family protein [Acidobacteriota bacterium]